MPKPAPRRWSNSSTTPVITSPLVIATCWLSHLEHDWQSPVWRHFLLDFGRVATVLFSDESERVYQSGGLEAFQAKERESAREPLRGGPFKGFLAALNLLQREFSDEECPIRTALVTARSAPAHKRVILTLREWGVRLDEALFLGGRDKGPFLQAFGADLFFDDSRHNVENARLGKITDYDRLVVEVWTNGAVSPDEALMTGVVQNQDSYMKGRIGQRVAARGVTVNSILPGAFDTDRLRSNTEAGAKKQGIPVDQALSARMATVPAKRFQQSSKPAPH